MQPLQSHIIITHKIIIVFAVKYAIRQLKDIKHYRGKKTKLFGFNKPSKMGPKSTSSTGIEDSCFYFLCVSWHAGPLRRD